MAWTSPWRRWRAGIGRWLAAIFQLDPPAPAGRDEPDGDREPPAVPGDATDLSSHRAPQQPPAHWLALLADHGVTGGAGWVDQTVATGRPTSRTGPAQDLGPARPWVFQQSPQPDVDADPRPAFRAEDNPPEPSLKSRPHRAGKPPRAPRLLASRRGASPGPPSRLPEDASPDPSSVTTAPERRFPAGAGAAPRRPPRFQPVRRSSADSAPQWPPAAEGPPPGEPLRVARPQGKPVGRGRAERPGAREIPPPAPAIDRPQISLPSDRLRATVQEDTPPRFPDSPGRPLRAQPKPEWPRLAEPGPDQREGIQAGGFPEGRNPRSEVASTVRPAQPEGRGRKYSDSRTDLRWSGAPSSSLWPLLAEGIEPGGDVEYFDSRRDELRRERLEREQRG